MTDQFDPPAKTIGIDLHHFLGALVLVRPIEIRYQQKTRYGLADATVADIHVLDGPGAGYCVRSTMIWPKLLQAALAPGVGTGRFTLGRITQGEAKQGEDPPWILSDPNEADAALARRYMASEVYQRNAGINVSGPDRSAQQPAPWGQQPAQQPAPWGQQQQPAPAAAAPWGGAATPPPPPAPALAPSAPPWGGTLAATPPAGDPWGTPPPAAVGDDVPPF